MPALQTCFKRLILGLVAASLNFVSGHAFGWGAVGHRIVARVGSTYAGGFWAANSMGMVTLTTAPDMVYKRLPTADIEKPTHFFQPDSYFPSQSQFGQIPQSYNEATTKYGDAFVVKNGTSPWRARQFYDLAVNALRQGDYKTGLEYASIMSHYVGDMSQPLHVTKNYDGQETGQEKIHVFFESINIEQADLNATTTAVAQATKVLLADPNFRAQFKGSLNNVAFNEINRAYALKDTLLSIDKSQGRTGQGAANLLKLAIARMADGAATLTLVLNHMWADAGNPTGGETVDVQVPNWLAPTYNIQATQQLASMVLDDDCQ
jgi:hypothetical protein